MKKHLSTLVLLLLALVNLHAQSDSNQKDFLSLNGVSLIPSDKQVFTNPKFAWYTNSANAVVDYQTLYNNKPSLRISSTTANTIDKYFRFSNRDIVGSKIVFSGKYKYKDAKDSNTMVGAFYPYWGLNQRAGVKIDIPVE